MTVRSRLRELPQDRPLGSLVLSVLLVEAVGASGAVFTARGLASWYDTLQRPDLAPPNWVFAPVWTTLFALMGLAVWLVWRRLDDAPAAARVAIGAFAAQFVFNLAWSAAFFGAQNIALGLLVIAVLWLLIAVTILTFARVDRRAAALLVPYLLWVSFAAYLNYEFWLLN